MNLLKHFPNWIYANSKIYFFLLHSCQCSFHSQYFFDLFDQAPFLRIFTAFSTFYFWLFFFFYIFVYQVLGCQIFVISTNWQTAHSWNPPPFIKGDLSFWNFRKKGGSFSHKKGGVGKIEGCFKKRGVSFIFIVTNPF